MCFTKRITFLQITIIRHENASLSLYGFYQKSDNIRVSCKHRFQSFSIVKWNTQIAAHIRAKSIFGCFIGTKGNNVKSPAMKIALHSDNRSLIGRYLFYFISPFRSEEHTSELQSRENLVCRLL